jgi:integrase
VDDPDGMILQLGRSHRGESAKTGRNQGVRLDYPHSQDIVRARLKGLKNNGKVFPISAAIYRKWWWWAASRVGVLQPPHACRHTGASYDLASGYRTYDQVAKRGRWAADKAMQRYAQIHKWVTAVASQPQWVRHKGQKLLDTRAPRALVAT